MNKLIATVVGVVVVVSGLLFGNQMKQSREFAEQLSQQDKRMKENLVMLLGELDKRSEQRLAMLKDGQNPTLGAFVAPGFNSIDKTIVGSTTTLSTNAQIVMVASSSRIYGLIQNDSDTDLYIYLRNFGDNQAASTTVIRNQGVRLVANGGAYEILPENAYNGEVWVASTTVSGKKLITTER